MPLRRPCTTGTKRVVPPPRPAAPQMIPSKDQYQCRVHAAVRAEEDAGPWQGVSVLDGRVDVDGGADGDGVRGVLVLVLVLLVPVWEGSRFAFLGVELGE